MLTFQKSHIIKLGTHHAIGHLLIDSQFGLEQVDLVEWKH